MEGPVGKKRFNIHCIYPNFDFISNTQVSESID